jgi:hypothetical protein
MKRITSGGTSDFSGSFFLDASINNAYNLIISVIGYDKKNNCPKTKSYS